MLGIVSNDPVDTQGPGIFEDNARGIDPDHADFIDRQSRVSMGGPYEAVYDDDEAVTLEQGPTDRYYPPCRPSPADDNCIQLYERGVRR